MDALVAELRDSERGRTLVFVRTKHGADRLVKRLGKQRLQAVAMHGNKNQNQRNRALAQFAAGNVDTLVATDVAARGIDVDDITHVINFDAPGDRDAYVHRVGRTARAGRDGTGVTFVLAEQDAEMRKVARDLGLTAEYDHSRPERPQAAGSQRSRNGRLGPTSHQPRSQSQQAVTARRSSGVRVDAGVKTIRACFAAVLAACLLPATASAATVSVVEETLAPVPPRERATLLYEGTPGEDNIASIVPAGEEGDSLRYGVTDLHAPLTAGPGCSGGGAPGVAATCLLPRSRPPTRYGSACTDGGKQIVLRFALGDGDDELRGARIPPDDGGGGNIAVQAEGGVGDDQLYTGQTSDTLDPGPGSDTVRSNQGDDVVDAGDSPDGADHYDLRDGLDQIRTSTLRAPLGTERSAADRDEGPP